MVGKNKTATLRASPIARKPVQTLLYFLLQSFSKLKKHLTFARTPPRRCHWSEHRRCRFDASLRAHVRARACVFVSVKGGCSKFTNTLSDVKL